MLEGIIPIKFPVKELPRDCVICATSPGLYINQFNIFHANFYCYHGRRPAKPHFEVSPLFMLSNIFCNILLMIGIINDLKQIAGQLSTKHVLIMVEIFVNTATILINTSCLLKHKIKIKESHGLFTLLHHKLQFGVDEFLNSTSAKKIHTTLLYLLIFMFAEELLTFCRVVVAEDLFDVTWLIRLTSIEIITLANASVGFYAVHFFMVYQIIMERCLRDIEECLRENNYHTTCIEKLQKLQRLYMALMNNFKLNEDFIQPGLILIFSLVVCLLLIGYSYFGVLFVIREVAWLKYDYYLVVKSMALVVGFVMCCLEGRRMCFLAEDTLSFLFKYPISGLSALEQAQVEMLVATLTLQRPELRASDIFTVGTGLLTSVQKSFILKQDVVSSTVLTYVLVALQFHAIWAAK